MSLLRHALVRLTLLSVSIHYIFNMGNAIYHSIALLQSINVINALSCPSGTVEDYLIKTNITLRIKRFYTKAMHNRLLIMWWACTKNSC